MQGGLKGNRYGTNKFEEITRKAQEAARPVNAHEEDVKSPEAIDLPPHGHPHTIGYPAHAHDFRTGA